MSIPSAGCSAIRLPLDPARQATSGNPEACGSSILIPETGGGTVALISTAPGLELEAGANGGSCRQGRISCHRPGITSDCKQSLNGRHRARRILMTDKIDKQAVLAILNRILEQELAGVVRYTHYALMIYGYNRIPIVSWMQAQADESLGHARQAGEMITHLGEHPSLAIGALLETHKHDIGDILRESLEHERAALASYKELLALVNGRSVLLEEYARQLIMAEEMHQGEVDKMLRKPGEVGATSG
jgi:bacterioferritin